MKKIKNDRTTYTTRAGLYAAKQDGRVLKERSPSRSREDTYLTAPIDRGGYIDFREKPPNKRVGLRRRG